MKKFFIPAAVATLLVSGCATMIDHSSQRVSFEAVGATEVSCLAESGKLKYSIQPPQTITLKKSRRDLILDCTAAGNRNKKFLLASEASGWTLTNIGNGIIPGTAYDAETGAMFKYPERVVLDFTDTVAAMDALPGYEAADALDPALADMENLGSNSAKLPSDASRSLRHKMAYMQYDRDQAVAAEKEARRDNLEGGWDAGKGLSAHPSSSEEPANDAPAAATPSGYVPPAFEPPADTSSETPKILPEPIFPATTSF